MVCYLAINCMAKHSPTENFSIPCFCQRKESVFSSTNSNNLYIFIYLHSKKATAISIETCDSLRVMYQRIAWVRVKSLSHVWLFATPCMDCSLPGSSVQGIFQARILEWAAISFSRGSSQPRNRTQVSRTVGRRFTIWASREVKELPGKLLNMPVSGNLTQ